ncbi:MAG TPA: trypsin-like peptidase domain-containing protein [Polyangiales bacterium]|nr:trypsin-like peptidase domain-containing protein [Polyangiales bacterium]
MGGRSGWVPSAVLCAALAAVCVSLGPLPAATRAQPASAPPAAAGLSSAEALQAAFVQVAESVSKSVVAMRIESRRKLVNPFEGFPFGEWFGGPGQRDQYQIQRGTGSGVVLRADGYILTNKHVVEDASRVEVVFQDGQHLVGKTVGIDDATDLAVVRVQAKNLVAARFADSSRSRPGEWVVAIGSPFGLDYTVTVGVVSAIGRGELRANDIEDYVQTDASINPGNSGGPLVNLRGEVLGINTMIVGQGTGIGFAIPSNLARVVSDQLIEKGSVRRSYIGVAFQPLTVDLAKHFGVEGKGGALVSSVVPGGPAEKGGVKPGDVIVSLDSQPIKEHRDLMRVLLEKPIGAKVTVGVVREGKTLSLPLTTVERESAARAQKSKPQRKAAEVPDLGLQLEALTPERAARLGYRGRQGALVVGVVRGSMAERAELAQGDLIVEADRQVVTGPAEVEAALQDGSALLRVLRRDSALYIVLSKDE